MTNLTIIMVFKLVKPLKYFITRRHNKVLEGKISNKQKNKKFYFFVFLAQTQT